MERDIEIDLADAQLTGFAQARSNKNSIIELIEGMGLEKYEWEKLKKQDRTRLNKADFEEVENYFKEM